MLIYTTARKSYWPYVLQQWSVYAGIFGIIIIYDQFFGKDLYNFKDTFYAFSVTVVVLKFITLMSRSRIYKVVLDEDARTITQHYRSLISDGGEKIYTLSKMQLYVKSKASASKMITRSLILYKDRREALLLDAKKDGFSAESLQGIRQALEKLGVPVTA